MSLFIDYQPVQSIADENTALGDTINHCKNWRDFFVKDDSVTSVHEITHGINANLRNSAITTDLPPARFNGKEYSALIKPLRGFLAGRQNSNGFYCLHNQGIIVTEPTTRKRDCVKYIPRVFQASRFNLYVTGQSEWDDTPLYLFDEWVAYANGAEAAITEKLAGTYKGGESDWIYGPIEFIAYAVATLMAAANTATGINPVLAEFSKWHLDRCLRIYQTGKTLLPWHDADTCYENLVHNVEGAGLREFLHHALNYDFIKPPTPSSDEMDYMV